MTNSVKTYEEFERVCALIESNDPTTVDVQADDDEWPMGYGQRLGEALLHNTTVTTLGLNVNGLVKIVYEEELEEESRAAKVSMVPLLQYLGSSTVLKNVHTHDDCTGSHPIINRVFGEILTEIAKSKSIEQFSCWTPLPMHRFVQYMTETTSLKHLELSMDYCVPSRSEEYLMVEALAANTTLESIRLSYQHGDDDVLIATLVHGLESHPTIECVALQGHENQLRIPTTHAEALITLVLSNPPKLRQVVLADFYVGQKVWRRLVSALQSNSNMDRLSLESCRVGRHTTQLLIQHVRQSAMAMSDTATTATARPIDLSVSWSTSHRHSPEMFKGKTLAEVLTRLWKSHANSPLLLRHNEPSPTIDRKASVLQLTSLCFSEILGRNLEQLAKCLPHALHLRDLTISDIRDYGKICHENYFLRALKRNGSLYEVTITEKDYLRPNHLQDKPVFGTKERRLIQAYCERNRHAPKLLSSLRKSTDDNEDGSYSRLQLVAPLLVAAAPAWKTAPNSTLIGLLSAKTDVSMGSLQLSRLHGAGPKKRRQQRESRAGFKQSKIVVGYRYR